MRTNLPWPQLFAVALGASSLLTSAVSPAQVPIKTDATATETGEAGARTHFENALELYRSGHYREALAELQQAAKLDPDGKDLFFNLALVHEKLGQLPEAVAALERFRELETDDAERERARLGIERLRGAEQAAEVTPSASAICKEPPPVAPTPPAKTPSAVLIGAGSVAVVSLVVGAVFGAKALSDDVSGSKTSPSLSVTALHERGQRAEREALVADVAFAFAAASSATFAGVWLLAPSDPAKRAAFFTLGGYF